MSNQQKNILCLVLGIISLAACKQESSFSGGAKQDTPRKSQNNAEKPVASQKPIPSQLPVPSVPTVIVPLPTNAVVQGSFTVWAVPPNPKEGENYDIHVLIKLPSNTSSYAKEDLSGTLTGTDGYSQTINDAMESQRFLFTPASGSAELIMPVPGAEQGVDDTLRVTSRLISESQTIVVHFN